MPESTLVCATTDKFYCPKCNTVRLRADFWSSKTRPDGIRRPCKHCMRVYSRVYQEMRREKDPELARRLDKAYCFEKRRKNPALYKAIGDKFSEAHPGYDSQRDSKRYWRDVEASRKRGREAAKRYPESRRVIKARRRTKLQDCGEVLTSAEWSALLERYGFRCAYCNVDGKLTLDHVVPVAAGGKTSISNCVPACLRCNLRKNKSSVEEFVARMSRDGITVRNPFDQRFMNAGGLNVGVQN